MKHKLTLPGMLIILSESIIILAACILIFLLIISPGKPSPLRDRDNRTPEHGINEKIFMNIGGVKQGMFIRGNDENNPVLLFVHGGPSFSEFFLVEKYPTGLENYFTVCYWEERGGGISYSSEVTMESMTLEQLAYDAVEVTNYLRNRFKKEKIYLMAHSGGTVFAIRAIAENPQLYNAYIGISQITNQAESEKIAWTYMLDQYQSLGEKKKVSAFGKYPLTKDDSFILPFFNSMLRDESMHELGVGTMRNMKSILTGVFYPVWLCRAYTLGEKVKIWYSKFSFVNKTGLRKQVLSTDIPAKFPALSIPVYFFSGKYDLTVNHELSADYLEKLQCPSKGFYTFENSAHSPMYEEPERFLQIMTTDVLHQQTTMADH